MAKTVFGPPLSDDGGLVFSVSLGEEQAGHGTGGPDYYPPFGSPVVGQGRGVLRADHLLGDVQPAGRAGEARLLGDGGEVTQVPQLNVHRGRCYRPRSLSPEDK